MIKKIEAFIISACLIIVFMSVGAQAAEGTIDNRIKWTLNDGVLRITGTGEIPDYTISAFAPWYKHSPSVKSVIVENGITRIGSYAFLRMTELENVNLPNSLISIGNSAFSGCVKLSGVIFPDNLKTLGDSVFYGCSSVNIIYINAALSEIGSGTFGAMKSFKGFMVSSANSEFSAKGNVLFADGGKTLVAFPYAKGEEYDISSEVSKIGAGAFRGSALKKVNIPSTVETIENAAFAECISLKEISLSEGLKTIGDNAFMLTGLENVVFPSSVNSIGSKAFKYSQSLVCASFNGNAPICGEEAFFGCDPVFSIHIKQSCKGFTVPEWNSYRVVVDGVYDGECGDGVKYSLDTKDGVLKISGNGDIFDFKSKNDTPWNEFRYGIKSIEIGDGITRIGSYAFSDCFVDSVLLPDSVSSIGEYAFSEACVAKSFRMSNNLKEIENNAFAGCKLCFRISIPSSVQRIGSGAFSNVSGLKSLFFAGDAPVLEDDVFAESPDIVIHYMPSKTGYDKIQWTEVGASAKYAGDCNKNGYINTEDVIILMKYNAGWNVDLSVINADVNSDNTVNTNDVILLMKYLAGWDVILY